MKVNGAALLADVASLVRRYVVLAPEQADVVALWSAHTHAIDVADHTPYLQISSAEKRSGKTKLLEVLQLLVATPWFTGRVSAAALYRKIDQDQPTLLLDESDAAFNSGDEYAECLRGILNSGHKRGGRVTVCIPRGAESFAHDYDCFCPKAIAGLGRLPDTVADRSLPIRLRRRARTEVIERFREKKVKPSAAPLKEAMVKWITGIMPRLKDAEPQLPEELSDRQQDGAEPLLAIADAAGGQWPERARKALLAICQSAAAEDDSLGIKLLEDVRQIFEERKADRVTSAALVEALAQLEGRPWAEYAAGRPITANKLARLLAKYEISPRTIRVETGTSKGYLLGEFQDSFSRYLPSQNVTAAQLNNDAGFSPISETQQAGCVTDAKSAPDPHKQTVVTDVTVCEPNKGLERDYLLDAVIEFCEQKGYASVEAIMDALAVSRREANAFIDKMEKLGLLGPATDDNPRPFLSPARAN